MDHRSTCWWMLVALSTAGCISERRDVERAPLGVTEGEGGSASESEGGEGGGDATGGGAADAGAAPRGEGEACDDGEVQECIIEVGEQNGKKTCFSGKRRCRDGRWGPCHYVPGQPDHEG